MKQSPLELFLDRLNPTERQDQLAFFRVVAAAGPDAIDELAGRIHRVSCPPSLRRLTVEFTYYYPWPGWCPVIDRLLRHEKDLGQFETGVRALGRMQTPKSLAALRALSLSRATPGFSEAVNGVLLESDPAEAFQHHFGRLLQGSAQAADANEGAHQLAKLLKPESLEPLKAGVRHPDALVYRHALRLVGQIHSPEAATFLLEFLQGLQMDILEDREARALLVTLKTLPRPEVLEKVLQVLAARCQEEPAEELASGQPDRIQAAALALREAGPGLLNAFLLDILLAAVDEKPASLTKQLSQAGEGAQQQARRIDFAMDSAAQSLAAMACQGLIEAGEVLPVLADSLRRDMGNPGISAALARLVPPEAQDLLDLLLEQPEGALRSAAMEVLGERREEALRPALLRLLHDAIADITDRSLWHLGQLPDPAGTARALLDRSDPEEVLMGLRFISMHHLEALVPDLLERIAGESRETVLVATFETLGGIGSPRAVEPLLALLHTGQGPRIQLALGEALRDMGVPAGALELCAKAKAMNTPALHTLAVEALARAYDSGERPLPPWEAETLLQAARDGWSERNPWPARRRISDAFLALHVQDPAIWTDLLDLVQTTLGEKRAPGSVAPEDLAHLQACARALAQRAHG